MKRKNIRVLGLIPARGGSKGVPRKNIKLLNGKPLIEWSAEALLKSKLIDTCICSTDDKEIAKIVENLGVDIPFIRPKKLAEDDSLVVDVIIHALDFFNKKNITFSHVMLVQPTNPTIKSSDIDNAVNLAKNNDYDTIISVHKYSGIHPAVMYKKRDNEIFEPLLPNSSELPRQKFEEIYARSGLFYLIKTEVLKENKSIYGEKIHAIEIDEKRAIPIDTDQDFCKAEKYLRENS
tara:strand:+ start:1425 stop:2129 length:705 start_codon:yes stop_codon:yes gene_type:complete